MRASDAAGVPPPLHRRRAVPSRGRRRARELGRVRGAPRRAARVVVVVVVVVVPGEVRDVVKRLATTSRGRGSAAVLATLRDAAAAPGADIAAAGRVPRCRRRVVVVAAAEVEVEVARPRGLVPSDDERAAPSRAAAPRASPRSARLRALPRGRSSADARRGRGLARLRRRRSHDRRDVRAPLRTTRDARARLARRLPALTIRCAKLAPALIARASTCKRRSAFPESRTVGSDALFVIRVLEYAHSVTRERTN